LGRRHRRLSSSEAMTASYAGVQSLRRPQDDKSQQEHLCPVPDTPIRRCVLLTHQRSTPYTGAKSYPDLLAVAEKLHTEVSQAVLAALNSDNTKNAFVANRPPRLLVPDPPVALGGPHWGSVGSLASHGDPVARAGP
jgi:hypothetical protein